MLERFATLSARFKLVLSGRLIIAILALGAVLFYQMPLQATVFHSPRFLAAYIVLAIVCFSDIIYLLLLKFIKETKRLEKLVILQIAIDTLLTTFLAYFTGGSSSIFVAFYFALILIANIVISARVGIFFASLSSIELAIISIIYGFGARGYFPLPLLEPEYLQMTSQGIRSIFPYIFFFALILHFMAFWVGKLVKELTYERLLKKRILEDMNNGVIVLSSAGEILYSNSGARIMLGIDMPADFSEMSIKTFYEEFINSASGIDPDQKSKLLDFAKLLLSQSLFKVDLDIPINLNTLPKDNQEALLLEIKAAALASDDKKISGNIIMIDNVTFKKKLEQSAKQGEFLKSLQAMSTGMAHEIRNPLTSIKGAIQELEIQLKSNLTEDQGKLITTVAKESERLNGLVSNFMDFARERKPIYRKIDLIAIINETLILIKTSKPSHIKIYFMTPPDQDKIICEVDAEQMKQVLYNLILNAIQALKVTAPFNPAPQTTEQKNDAPPESAITIKIFASANPYSSANEYKPGITIEISDTGKGIPAQDIHKIFEPFYTTRSDGIGLGMSIVRRIVDNHQGIMNVESKVGKGTRVSIWLPQNVVQS